jgi:chaperone modulatory protein CbpM
MSQNHIHAGLLIDEIQLTADELACACRRDVQWVMARSWLICGDAEAVTQFSSAELTRARRLADMETVFEIDEEVAGLVVDLIEEVERLKRALKMASM